MIETRRDLFRTGNQTNSPVWEDQHAHFELLARVASLYYLEDKTQQEIAKETGLSRQKVQRLLRQAREQHIVEIHVHAVPVYHVQLEAKLKEIFHLKDAIVAPFHPDEHQRRYSVAYAAADYLERHTHDGFQVAVGLGRNASEVANNFHPNHHLDCTFISAMGGAPQSNYQYNPNEIATRFASRSGGKTQLLYAPAYVEKRKVRDMLLAQDAVKATIQLAQHADAAVIGIGTANDDSILIRAGCQSVEDVRLLRSSGAVGEILGNYFDQYGYKVPSDLHSRVISLSLQEIAEIPLVIAIASEPEKPMALYGALRTKVINTLVVDCQLAIAVLRLAGVNDLKEEHELLGILSDKDIG
jgi:DNA-binding transcriptional regulator LsrR (DeoR family)